ncbi:MAG: arginase family protein [Syntrophales bacterium]|nr:arginase family protein [Syntrophales bacterium]
MPNKCTPLHPVGWRVLILNFDDTYFFQPRLLQLGHAVDLRDIKGTRYLCARETMEMINKRIEEQEKCITFIGKGDFHYITFVFLRRFSFPFTLLLIDNHLDIKDTFEGYVSCGSWLKEAIELPHLRRVIFIGDGQEKKTYFDKIYFVCSEDDIMKRLDQDPVYISIDKDAIDPAYIKTSFDQGSISLDTLLRILSALPKQKVIGMDICGEPDGFSLLDHGRSEKINLHIVSVFSPFSPPIGGAVGASAA